MFDFEEISESVLISYEQDCFDVLRKRKKIGKILILCQVRCPVRHLQEHAVQKVTSGKKQSFSNVVLDRLIINSSTKSGFHYKN
jgi:hypothetical protein